VESQLRRRLVCDGSSPWWPAPRHPFSRPRWLPRTRRAGTGSRISLRRPAFGTCRLQLWRVRERRRCPLRRKRRALAERAKRHRGLAVRRRMPPGLAESLDLVAHDARGARLSASLGRAPRSGDTFGPRGAAQLSTRVDRRCRVERSARIRAMMGLDQSHPVNRLPRPRRCPVDSTHPEGSALRHGNKPGVGVFGALPADGPVTNESRPDSRDGLI
jgi:hypothetical protein